MSADIIARLKITLEAVKPVVLRRIEVPFDIRLDRLHLTIQAALGWTNSHLMRFVPAMLDGARSIPKPIGPKTFSRRARRVSTR
jgi:hypothetical protein